MAGEEPGNKRFKPSVISDHVYSQEFQNSFSKHWQRWKSLEAPNIMLISSPFRVCRISNFIKDESFMEEVKAELSEVKSRRQSIDLYQFEQTYDLANIESQNLRFLYETFQTDVAAWMEENTRIELNRRISMSSACYTDTDYLLCHDDNMGDRRIAFVLYLSQNWCADDGGTLDLFDTDDDGVPRSVVKSLVPEYNSLVFFEVTENSYHQVAEVTSADKTRWTINGWFHGPLRLSERPPRIKEQLTYIKPEEISVDLDYWITDTYLVPGIVKQIHKDMEDQSYTFLPCFLKPDIFENLSKEVESDDIVWTQVGPPDVRNYEIADENTFPDTLRQFYLMFKSLALFKLLKRYTELDLVPKATPTTMDPRMTIELQRWTSGCYTLICDKPTGYESSKEDDGASTSSASTADTARRRRSSKSRKRKKRRRASNNSYGIEAINEESQDVNEGINEGFNEEISQDIDEVIHEGFNEELSQDINEGIHEGFNEELSQDINEGIHEGFNVEISQDINEGINEGFNEGFNEEISQDINEGINEGFNGVINEEISQDINEGINEDIIGDLGQEIIRDINEDIGEDSNEGIDDDIREDNNEDINEGNDGDIDENSDEESEEEIEEEFGENINRDSFDPVVNRDSFDPVVSDSFDPVVSDSFDPVVNDSFDQVINVDIDANIESAIDEDEILKRLLTMKSPNKDDGGLEDIEEQPLEQQPSCSNIERRSSPPLSRRVPPVNPDSEDSDVSDIGDYLSDPQEGSSDAPEVPEVQEVPEAPEAPEKEPEEAPPTGPATLDVIMNFHTNRTPRDETIDYVDARQRDGSLIHVPYEDNHLCVVYKNHGIFRVQRFVNHYCKGYFYNLVCTYWE